MILLFAFLRFFLRFLLRAAAAVLVLAVLLALFAGFTTPGARLAANLVERLASTPERQISITDPSALLTGHLTIGGVTVADSRGTYADLKDISVRWSPLSLLGFEFAASELTIGEARLDRLPDPSSEPASDSGFSLPVAIRIERYQIAALRLSPEIAGEARTVGLGGAVDATSASIAFSLDLTRPEQPQAKASAQLDYDPAANVLVLKADIAEPPGGLLAGLLRLPGTPAVTLSLAGEGPLSDWAGTATAGLDGQERLSLKGRHLMSTDGLRSVTLTGGGAFDVLMPPMLRPLFEGQTAIDLAADIEDGKLLRISKGSIATGALTLSASGTMSTTGANNLQVSLTGTDGPVPLQLPVSGSLASLALTTVNLSVIGDATSAILDVVASADQVTHAAGAAESIRLALSSDAFDLSTQSGTVGVTLNVGETRLTDPNLDRLLRGPAKLVGTLALKDGVIAFNPLTLESASIGGTVTGQFDQTAQTIAAKLQLFALPGILPPDLAARFATTIALSGDLSADLTGSASVNNLVVKSDVVEAAGSVSLTEGNLTAALNGTLPDLSLLLADARGTAGFTLGATGPTDNLAVTAGVTSSGATLSGRTLSDLVASGEATLAPGNLKADLRATGALAGQAIDISLSLVPEEGRTTIPALKLRVGDNIAEGALVLDQAFRPEGRLTFTFPDIGLIAALAGQQAGGDLAGSIDVTAGAQPGSTALMVTAQGKALQRGDLSIIEPVLSLEVADLATLAAKGQVKAKSITQGANSLTALSLDFDRKVDGTAFSLDAGFDGAPLTARGDLITGTNGIDIRLASFSAAPRRVAMKLSAPTTITIREGVVRLDGLGITAGGGSIAVSGSAGAALDLSARLSAVPANLANVFVPALGAEGTIAGTVRVTGTAAQPSVGYDLAWSRASVSQARAAGFGALDVVARGTFAGDRVSIETTLSGGGLSFRGGGTVGISGNRPLALNFTGKAPFGLVSALLAAQGLTLTGGADVNLSVTGPATAPVIAGQITTSGARLVDVRRNLAVNDLAADIALSAGQANIRRLTGTLSTGGSIEASGTIGIQAGSGFPANLKIGLRDATYVDGTLFSASASGDLTITGSLLSTPVLGGEVRIVRAAITIPEKLPASLSELSITHRNASSAVNQQAERIVREAGTGSNGSGGVAFNLTVNAPGQVFVRGRGIDAELGGSLTITGTSAAPQVSGGFDLRRGRLEILGKRLDFTDGRIGFGGNLVPTVDLAATSTAGSTTVTVNVAGNASNPTVTFASSPALPQDEILAQLIFNRSLSNLSALQIAQLASAVAQLAGGNSTSLLDGLRNKLGVDDLDVTTDENGGAQVRAGKYLNDRTYIELQQGSEAGSGKATINLDIGRGVKLRGEAGSDGSGAAGIFYEKEY